MIFKNKKEKTSSKEEYDIDKEFDNSIGKTIRYLTNKFKYILIILIIIILSIIIFLSIKPKHKQNEVQKPIEYTITLKGNDNITIYQGEEYNEPGYIGLDNLNNDLTKEIVVDNQIDTNIPGTYQIIYTLGNVSKIRNITVVEKPVGTIELSLKGSDTIYLSLNEKYIEPGYTATDSIDGDITEQVEIESNLDINKTGTYQIIYSVKNSTEITSSVTRTIIVSTSEIKLTASSTSYTNKDITIKINVTDNYFEYLLLPNGNKVTNKNYEYKVSTNGTYKFVAVSTSGKQIEKSISISNIDKVAPTGSCTGSYQNGKSKINVKATDNVGISRYVINDIAYVYGDITINKELQTVNVTIYDKVGNSKTITCNLENKNK